MLQQLSIYAENKKGTMQHITEILEKEKVNILGSVTNDSAEYGIIRMVISDPVKAVRALTEEGFLCKTSDVIGVEIEDTPGALNRLLKALDNSNININYLYLSFDRESARPVIVLHTDDAMEVEACIEAKGFVCRGTDNMCMK